MTILEALRTYLLTCPLLEGNKINIDYMSDNGKGIEYSIDTSPGEEVVKRYLSGGAMCQLEFNVRSADAYSPDTLQQIESSGFYEKLKNWMWTQNRKRNLPELPEGFTATNIEALSSGYLAYVDNDIAQYQIQCRLTYLRQ